MTDYARRTVFIAIVNAESVGEHRFEFESRDGAVDCLVAFDKAFQDEPHGGLIREVLRVKTS